ncbi:MAG: hypothetical protein LH471_08045, partial [Salinibacterium sp.]|nr:hypothetical protein [Salinibacterium sp.]
DTQGGHRIASGVYTQRLDPSSRIDPHYVAVCLAAKWNERHHKGDSMKNVKPGDLEIPLLPRDAQLQWVLQFRNLETVKSDARKLLEIAERLEGAAQDALRFGHAETSDGAEGLRPTSL